MDESTRFVSAYTLTGSLIFFNRNQNFIPVHTSKLTFEWEGVVYVNILFRDRTNNLKSDAYYTMKSVRKHEWKPHVCIFFYNIQQFFVYLGLFFIFYKDTYGRDVENSLVLTEMLLACQRLLKHVSSKKPIKFFNWCDFRICNRI